MRKFILGVLMLSIAFSGYFSDNFLKYSTFYGSVSLESPFTPKQKFAVDTQEGTFEETTEEIEGSYNYSIGLRKLARFKYQSKKSSFYDGTENELSDVATLGAVSGWEYLFKLSQIRNFGEEYIDSESWLRYLGNWFVLKGSYTNFGRQDLEFGQVDARLRKSVGASWNFSLGGNLRGHPAYGLFPFNDWLVQHDDHWWELAYEYGYHDEEYGIGAGMTDFSWFDEDGNVVASTDDEFYEYVYGDLIHRYNEDEVDRIGWQYEASAVVGIDFYKYAQKWWLHSWASVMPYSKGLTKHSYTYKEGDLDYDLGVVTGVKLGKHFGVFGEGRSLSYWGIDSYEIKAGLNYVFF